MDKGVEARVHSEARERRRSAPGEVDMDTSHFPQR